MLELNLQLIIVKDVYKLCVIKYGLSFSYIFGVNGIKEKSVTFVLALPYFTGIAFKLAKKAANSPSSYH